MVKLLIDNEIVIEIDNVNKLFIRIEVVLIIMKFLEKVGVIVELVEFEFSDLFE